jgi:hypothetical protein
MPQRDAIHGLVQQALLKEGWKITNDPYVISYGDRFLFIDLAAQINTFPPSGGFIGARLGERNIAVEIKEFRGNSAIADLEQAIGQYVLYRLLLHQVDPGREVYLAIPERIFDTIFTEPVGELVIRELPLKLIIINEEKTEVSQWIPPYETEKL